MLTHNDLKQQGLHLSQSEAQFLHPKIAGIAQGHITDGIVYPVQIETEPKSDPLREYYAELQAECIELRAEVERLNEIMAGTKLSEAISDKIRNIERENSELKIELELLTQKKKPGRPSLK